MIQQAIVKNTQLGTRVAICFGNLGYFVYRQTDPKLWEYSAFPTAHEKFLGGPVILHGVEYSQHASGTNVFD